MNKLNSSFRYVSVTLTAFVLSLLLVFYSCGKDSVEQEQPKEEEPKPDPVLEEPKPESIDVIKLLTSKTNLIKSISNQKVTKLSEGIEHITLNYMNNSDRAMSLNIIVADFSYKHVTAQVLNPYNTSEKRFQNLVDMTQVNQEVGTKIWAAINGDYFSWSNMETTGPFIHDGVVRKANPVGSTRPCFGVTRTNLPVFLNAPTGETNVYSYGDNLLKHLVSGNLWFIYNGTKMTINDTTVEPRTAIGMRSDKKIIAITVDGRQTAHSNGMSFVQLQTIYAALDAKFAFNLDGGGSTVMVARNSGENSWKVVNSPSEMPLRAIANGLGFVSTN